MESPYGAKPGKPIQELRLEILRGRAGYEDVSIRTEDVNRPGLQLTGFFDYPDAKRFQAIGHVETTYPKGLTSEERRESFELLLSQDIPALITSRKIEPFPECTEMAERYDQTILHSPDIANVLMSNITTTLKSCLALYITRYGVPVEVYGGGMLLLGESDVDKSEVIIELVKCSHRLIADDAMGIRHNVIDRLAGTALELIRHYIKLQGIGVIDVYRPLGMGAAKDEAEVGMVINLEQQKDEAMHDRLGLENPYTMILDAQVPSLTVPVRPGQNLAATIEVAAMNNRHKKMGYSAAVEFTKQISQYFDQAMSAQLNGD